MEKSDKMARFVTYSENLCQNDTKAEIFKEL